MGIRSPVMTLQLGGVSLFDNTAHCQRNFTYSPIPSSLEDALELMKHTGSPWSASLKASVLNVKGLMLMWIMIMEG